MSPLLAFSACWVWPDWLLDVADAECAGFDESPDRPEFGHVLGVCGGQFHVAISSCLAPVSLPRLDAPSELLEFTATDLPGAVRYG